MLGTGIAIVGLGILLVIIFAVWSVVRAIGIYDPHDFE